ncbi:MAG: hypothetical protein WD904_09585 [Dehalococcoidia bacterium]
MNTLKVVGEWIVLPPLWRKLTTNPNWRIAGAVGTGILWVTILVAIGSGGGGEGKKEDGAAAQRHSVRSRFSDHNSGTIRRTHRRTDGHA